MKPVLVLSPHLDDAAFSLGPYLAEIASFKQVIVATAFTKSVRILSDFALACQLDKNLKSDVDYMDIRRQEDTEWAKRIGVQVVHGSLPEAPHRGYCSAQALFGDFIESDKIATHLNKWLENLVFALDPSIIFCPFGIGNHVDHVWINRIASQSSKILVPIFFFKDQPYASQAYIKPSLRVIEDINVMTECCAEFSESSRNKAIIAAEAYKTQVDFQFGSFDGMKNVLNKAWQQSIPTYYKPNACKLSKKIFLKDNGKLCLD